MKRLIRNLFSLAVSNVSYPAVVLLETYSHGPRPSSTGKIDYPKSYSRLARHYSLPTSLASSQSCGRRTIR